jgi:signal transduction histidine kinase
LGVAAPDDLVAHADPARLQQALGNLVDNALRYGREPIALSAQARDGAVELHVRDAGEGFPSSFVAGAFERFSRADHARGEGGAGLGLAIVQAIARSHGGDAHIAAGPDGGADVWIAIPATTGRPTRRPLSGLVQGHAAIIEGVLTRL